MLWYFTEGRYGIQNSLLNVMVFYREKISHSNFSWHDNGTMTYTSQRNAIFDPELNNLSLNDTVFVPNLALLVSNFGAQIGRLV
jgi:hypothetical protein